MLYFVAIGLATSRFADLRMYFMMSSTIPPLVGFLLMALLPDASAYKWARWGGYFLTVPFVVPLFLAWTLIPSNTGGRTKRTLTSSLTFVGYCAGNMCGSQIFRSADAPRYVPGTVGCAVCFALQFVIINVWRLVYVLRNRRTRKRLAAEGVGEERVSRGQEMGQLDTTDFQNPYVSCTVHWLCLTVGMC